MPALHGIAAVRRGMIFIAAAIPVLFAEFARAQPDDFQGVVAERRPRVLCLPVIGMPPLAPLPKKSRLVSLRDLQFIGPMPSHPFVLGHFAVDGQWGMVRGKVGVIQGKNAALQIAWANEFELDGVIEHSGFGGWFFLVGWDNGRGYAIHNVLMKESGSPWFVSEFRGSKAVEGRTLECDKFDWKGEQPFRLRVRNNAFSLDVGKFHVFNHQPLENYMPGRVILGVYDTRYGPKTLSVKSLRIREIPPNEKDDEPPFAD